MFNRAILGLGENPSKELIEKAFKKKALLCHPDKGGNTEMMKLINQAKDQLLQQTDNADFLDGSLEKLNEILKKKTVEHIDLSSDRISTEYRELYSNWVNQVSQEEVTLISAYSYFKEFTSKLYFDVSLDCWEVCQTNYYKDLFDCIGKGKLIIHVKN